MVTTNTHFIHNPQAFLENAAMERAQKSAKSAMLTNLIGNSIFGAMEIAGACFAGKAGGGTGSKEVKDTPKKDKAEDTEVKDTQKEEESAIKPEDAVRKLVNDFDKLPDETQKDLVNKYTAIKTITPEINDEKLTERLNNYVKALEEHKIELEMYEVYDNAHDSQAIEDACNNCKLKIVDKDIEAAKDVTKDEFFDTRYNRGARYVELYDTNGDETIDFNEFKSLEEKDNGITLTNDDEVAMTQTVFNRLDKNGDKKIDATEMASHLYAVSRLYDSGAESTSEDITFKEWVAASTEVGSNDNITTRYNGGSDEFYEAYKSRKS